MIQFRIDREPLKLMMIDEMVLSIAMSPRESIMDPLRIYRQNCRIRGEKEKAGSYAKVELVVPLLAVTRGQKSALQVII